MSLGEVFWVNRLQENILSTHDFSVAVVLPWVPSQYKNASVADHFDFVGPGNDENGLFGAQKWRLNLVGMLHWLIPEVAGPLAFPDSVG